MQGSRTEIDMKNKITDKLFELAYTDYMTEVQNRNAYEERLKKLKKPNANLSRITVIVIDINGLKEINDGFGHFCGDDAIKTVAKALRETIGAKADIYRIGGDEFVCISESNILPYISQFKDTQIFALTQKQAMMQSYRIMSQFTLMRGKTQKNNSIICD